MKKGLMAYPTHRTKLFQNSFTHSSKILNTLQNKYSIKITIE